ncbi:MAG: DUF4156 domain-containing protein [Bdellovibrionota bacterium]
MKKILLFTPVAFLLFGCSSTSLDPGAESVRIMQSEPKGCKYLGEVTGNQGNSFTGSWTSNSNLETGARNDMKNKANAMHGNVIVMLTNRAGVTGSMNNGSGGSEQTNVTYTGTVFDCPPEK